MSHLNSASVLGFKHLKRKNKPYYDLIFFFLLQPVILTFQTETNLTSLNRGFILIVFLDPDLSVQAYCSTENYKALL